VSMQNTSTNTINQVLVKSSSSVFEGTAAGKSLSGFLCARHSMTSRSIYANKQDEVEERGDRGRVGRIAEDPQGTA
jgi:hypothetical protein